MTFEAPRSAGFMARARSDYAIVADNPDDTPPDAARREQLYTIAFAIVRADEDVTPREREYLRQVARALDLDDGRIDALERDAMSRIAESATER